jgi:predicted kinase
MSQPRAPICLIVNGLPATGKTTLAKWLAAQLGWPSIHKDEIKEILFDTLGARDREWSRMLGGATIEVLMHVVEMQLHAGVSCVAECNFKPNLADSHFRSLFAETHARGIQVFCRCDSAERVRRFQSRVRHVGHADSEITTVAAEALREERLDPLNFGGVLIEVDTTDLARVDYDDVLRHIRSHLLVAC